MTANEPIKVMPAVLQAYIAEILAVHGLPAADAREVAELMCEADLLGGDGHGVFRLPRYVDRLRAGGFNARPDIKVDRRKGAMARIDGDNAMGHLVVRRCVDEAIRLAGEHGVGWVGTHHSNHAGSAGTYALMPARRDMIGIYLAVGNANHMAPWGGVDLLLSTNPIAIGVPGASGPILLDMATTVAAYGKVKLAAQRGETMPEGWMIDGEGNPLTDPTRAGGGSLLPIGGPKGFGLSLMIGLLAGTLNSAACGSDVIDFNKDDTSATNTGQMIIVADVAAFTDLAVFKAQVDHIAGEIRASRRRPGFDEIRLPGDRALATREKRLAGGIPIPPALLAALRPVSEAAGVRPLDDR